MIGMIGRLGLVALLLAAMTSLLTGTASASTQHVMIEGYAYGPATITITAGDSVTWTNHDQAGHDVVTTSAPASFRSPLLATGQTWTFTFTKPGTYKYYCSVHPDMKAQIVVQAPPAAQPPPPVTTTVAAAPGKTTTAKAPTATAAAQAPAQAATTTTTQAVAAAPAAPEQAQPVLQTVKGEPVVTKSLDPRLFVAGAIAAVATLCLLLISARRPSAAKPAK